MEEETLYSELNENKPTEEKGLAIKKETTDMPMISFIGKYIYGQFHMEWSTHNPFSTQNDDFG